MQEIKGCGRCKSCQPCKKLCECVVRDVDIAMTEALPTSATTLPGVLGDIFARMGSAAPPTDVILQSNLSGGFGEITQLESWTDAAVIPKNFSGYSVKEFTMNALNVDGDQIITIVLRKKDGATGVVTDITTVQSKLPVTVAVDVEANGEDMFWFALTGDNLNTELLSASLHLYTS